MALELTRGNKDKKPKSGGPKNSDAFLKFVSFFEKNPFLKILIPVLLFVIVTALFLFIAFGDGVLRGKDDPAPVDATVSATDAVQVLPGNNALQDEDLEALIQRSPLSEDVLASAKYEGFVIGSSGLKTALISIGAKGDQLVLAVGETVGDSSWKLTEINSDYIEFSADGATKRLKK